jgi:hypothetical protein
MGNQQSISPSPSSSGTGDTSCDVLAARCAHMRARLDELKQPLHVYVAAPLGLRLDSISARLARYMGADLVEAHNAEAARRVNEHGRSLGDSMVEQRPGAHYQWHSNNLLAQRLRHACAPAPTQSVHVFARSPLDEVLGYARASYELGLLTSDEYALLMVQAESDHYAAHRLYNERHALFVLLRPDDRHYDTLVHHLCDGTLQADNALPAYYHHSMQCLDTLYRDDAAFVTRYYTLYVSMPTAEPSERECLAIAQTILSYTLTLVERHCWGLSAQSRQRALRELDEHQGGRAAVLLSEQEQQSLLLKADEAFRIERDPQTGYELTYRSPFAGRAVPVHDWPKAAAAAAAPPARHTTPPRHSTSSPSALATAAPSAVAAQRRPSQRHSARRVPSNDQ